MKRPQGFNTYLCKVLKLSYNPDGLKRRMHWVHCKHLNILEIALGQKNLCKCCKRFEYLKRHLQLKG